MTDLFRIQLRNIFRQNQESLPQLAQVIRNLPAKAYADAKGALLEILSKEHFSDALDDPDMRFKVFQSKPSALDEAVGIAVELEAFKQAEKHRPGGGWRKNVREIEIGEKTQFGNKESKEGYLESAIEKLTQVMDEMKTDIGTLKGGRSNWSESMHCWNCGELGHSRNGCKRDTIGDGFNIQAKGGKQGQMVKLQRTDHSGRRPVVEEKWPVLVSATSGENGIVAEGEIHGIIIKFLIDTGSAITLISRVVFESINEYNMEELYKVLFEV